MVKTYWKEKKYRMGKRTSPRKKKLARFAKLRGKFAAKGGE